MSLIQSTNFKLSVAKVIYKLLKPFYGGKRQIKRSGINFEIDISEGIDLNLFLFGNFQKHVYQNKLISLDKDANIIDVGGNVGAISLFLAKEVPNGKIFAFEPTYFALEKFNTNLKLNPTLKPRIDLIQSFVSSEVEKISNLKAYSSWNLSDSGTKHNVHGGFVKSSENVPSTTIDLFCRDNNLSRLDLIKIDTDGHEFEVLQGAKESLKKYQPQIVFEVGLYLLKERSIKFEDMLQFFHNVNYSVFTIGGKPINKENFESLIPNNGTIDAIAVPTT